MADNLAQNAMNGISKAQEAFKNMIKDKNKWLMLYLILIIVYIFMCSQSNAEIVFTDKFNKKRLLNEKPLIF